LQQVPDLGTNTQHVSALQHIQATKQQASHRLSYQGTWESQHWSINKMGIIIIIIIIIITRHAQLTPWCCSVIKHVKSLNLNLFCPAFPVLCGVKPHYAWHA
jgi:hypothetical protein